ncbi:hypothetical protein ACT4WO_19930 (plasmid) [Acinetobacter baumannii]
MFEEVEDEVLFQTTIKTKKSILNYLTPVSTLATLLQSHNIILPKGTILGSIIEIYDEEAEPRVIIGHEGSDFGNIKTVRQLEIYWEEVAF